MPNAQVELRGGRYDGRITEIPWNVTVLFVAYTLSGPLLGDEIPARCVYTRPSVAEMEMYYQTTEYGGLGNNPAL